MKQSQSPDKESQTEAVRRCFDAYGADVTKWPAEKRAELGALAMTEQFAALRNEAGVLDEFLAAASEPVAAADLENKIMAQFETPVTRAPDLLREAGSLFSRFRLAPAGAIAGFGLLGVATGLWSTNAQENWTPEEEAYAYVEASMSLTALTDEEGAAWDAE